jgi:hypothetical protein
MSLDSKVRKIRRHLSQIKRNEPGFQVGHGLAVDREIRRGPIQYLSDLAYNAVRRRDNSNIAVEFYDRFGDDPELGPHLYDPNVAKIVKQKARNLDTLIAWNTADSDGSQRKVWNRKTERYLSWLGTGLVVGSLAFPGVTAAIFGSTGLCLSLLFPIGVAKMASGWYHDIRRGGQYHTKLKHMAMTTAKEAVQAFYPLITPLGVPIPTSLYGVARSYAKEHRTDAQEQVLTQMKTELQQEIPQLYPPPTAAPQPAGQPNRMPQGAPAYAR